MKLRPIEQQQSVTNGSLIQDHMPVSERFLKVESHLELLSYQSSKIDSHEANTSLKIRDLEKELLNVKNALKNVKVEKDHEIDLLTKNL